MIQQAYKGLNSRSEASPYNEDGFLPLMTAPMYSVVDDTNYQLFLDNKIQVCLPRNIKIPLGTIPMEKLPELYENVWCTLSLSDFVKTWCNTTNLFIGNLTFPYKICIDTANGNMPALHEAIRKAKSIHGDRLIIMAGNIGFVEAFTELAKTGVDYIRVGIGGGGGCNTTANTGIGQENLETLVCICNQLVVRAPIYNEDRLRREGFQPDQISKIAKDWKNVSKVKIVADGISSYINHCQEKYNFNDNGYAAINKLLFAGANIVMVGKLFAQCIESAGEKRYGFAAKGSVTYDWLSFIKEYEIKEDDYSTKVRFTKDVKYAGMSTQREQKKYQPDASAIKEFSIQVSKPSEGSVSWIPVRWSLDEWLNGSENQDEAPYLMGWINSIKSAMAYTGKTSLH